MTADLTKLPLDLLQQAATTLNRYIQARRREKLLEEHTYLERELRATQASRAEIQALRSPTPLAVATAGPQMRTEETDHA